MVHISINSCTDDSGLAKALLVLNALERFSHLLDTGTDDLGLQLMNEALPKRIPRKSSSRGPETL
jgi:hypothetical protein